MNSCDLQAPSREWSGKIHQLIKTKRHPEAGYNSKLDAVHV
jgi:hypothetical protein